MMIKSLPHPMARSRIGSRMGLGPLLLSLAIWGAAGFNAASAATPADAQALVKDTSERMLNVLRKDHDALKAHPERIYALAEKIVLPHFDFQRMSRLVLGRFWRTADPQQQTRFIDEFRTLLVRTYGTALLDYTNQTLNYSPLRAAPDATDVVVHTEVQQPGGMPIPIDYRMYVKEGAWKVYDVIVDGVSLVTNYRNSFAEEIRKSGMDGLIKALVQRNQKSK
jgi:phospholipid transport system substrate-binding protein